MPKLKRIALILPRGKVYHYKTGAFGIFIRYAPLTFPTLISYTPKKYDISFKIYDEGIEKFDVTKINADLVGITAITGTSKRAYAYADYFRKKGIPVVLGGVHPTLLPHEAKQHADSVVTGLANHSWPKLLKDFKWGKLKEFYQQPKNTDFKNWPLPDRSCYEEKKMRLVTINSIEATYGCPNKCEFCVTPYSCKGYHHRPIKDVIDEIKNIKARHIVFVDPSPIENINYAKKLYKAMIPLKKKWMSPSTIRMADDKELLDLAAKSGCKGLLIGFESVTDQSLKNIKKGFNSLNKFYENSKKFHDKGIAIMGCFVFGLDSDDKSVFKRTLEFINKANIDLPRFTVNTPFPGTPFFNRMAKENRLLTKNWSLYDCQHVVIKPKKMTPLELQKGHHWIWREAYKLPYVFKRLSCSRSFLSVIMATNYAYRLYGRKLPGFTRAIMKDNSDIPLN